MAYRVQLKPSAAKDLDDLPGLMQKRVAVKIGQLGVNPFPFGVEKLKGVKGWLRVRAGDYRIVYEVQHESKIVFVHRIRHRREVYRDL